MNYNHFLIFYIEYFIKKALARLKLKEIIIGKNLSEMELNAERKQKFQQKMSEYINSVISMALLHDSIYFILSFF